MAVFTNTTPAANEVLATSQPLINGNFIYLQNSIGVDHNFTNNNATAQDGYHKIVHAIVQPGDPAPTANAGQIYTKLLQGGADSGLWYESPSGVITALTGKLSPNVALGSAGGYVYLAGQLLLQWGIVTGATQGINKTANFANYGNCISFPQNCFSVVLTPIRTSTNVDIVYVQSFNATTLTYSNTSSSISSFQFIAIGN